MTFRVPQRLAGRTIGSGLALFLMILATPRRASAYVDPGSGAMVWQAAAAACIGSLFYMRRVVMWARRHMDFRSPRTMGFLFAGAYALFASPLVCSLCQSGQVPRFGDIFLLGIILTTYFFTWEGAACLLGAGLVVSAWVLPLGGGSQASAVTLYRLVSFTVVSLFLICLITRLKAGRASMPVRQRSGMTVRRETLSVN
jgi:hypothetical protein